MSERRLLASGDVLAHRYELQDLVSEKLGSTTWRAHDQVLNRNVGIEMLSSSDPRADHFLQAARESTSVTDPRFLRVLDLIEDEQHHHLVVREWARAFPLDQLLAQSPLPNRRAATVIAEVAEAMAHAHEHGVYHRRLTPHQVLLKQSGAVRVVGLGVTTALSPVGRQDSLADLQAYEQLDVQAIGKLLYACLTSRWPGAQVDGLQRCPDRARPAAASPPGPSRRFPRRRRELRSHPRHAATQPRDTAAQGRGHRPHTPAVWRGRRTSRRPAEPREHVVARPAAPGPCDRAGGPTARARTAAPSPQSVRACSPHDDGAQASVPGSLPRATGAWFCSGSAWCS